MVKSFCLFKKFQGNEEVFLAKKIEIEYPEMLSDFLRKEL
jgi:hypothetical protein